MPAAAMLVELNFIPAIHAKPKLHNSESPYERFNLLYESILDPSPSFGDRRLAPIFSVPGYWGSFYPLRRIKLWGRSRWFAQFVNVNAIYAVI
jgi:hypothetical protein